MTAVRRRTREILVFVLVFLAARALFGEAIFPFMEGMYLGFTDGI